MVSDNFWEEFIEQHRRWIAQNPRYWFTFVHVMHAHREKYWFLSLLNRFTEALMARGKKQTTPANDKKVGGWTEFVDIPVGEEHVEHIGRYCATSDELFDAVQAAAEAGYRISFSYNPQTDAIICSVTCKDDESVNAGLTFTAFAGDWTIALRVAMYKHYIIAEQNWRGAGVANARPRFG